jgi:hypothetical protein
MSENLFAAAPELYEALQKLVSIVVSFHEFCDSANKPCGEYGAECPISMGEWVEQSDRDALLSALAVLRKARGESKAQS